MLRGARLNGNRRGSALTVFGICTIAMWLSYLAYVPPFVAWPDVTGVAKEVWKAKDCSPGRFQSQDDAEKKLRRSLYIAYSKVYAMAVCGVIAGVLLVAKRRSGRYLALALAALMIGGRIAAAVTHPRGMAAWIRIIYVELLSYSPAATIHKDIISPLFFVFTIAFLCHKTVSASFAGRRLTTG